MGEFLSCATMHSTPELAKFRHTRMTTVGKVVSNGQYLGRAGLQLSMQYRVGPKTAWWNPWLHEIR